MKFSLGERVEEDRVRDMYCLKTRFDERSNLELFTKNKDLIKLLIMTYDKYAVDLAENWNDHCNPEIEDVIKYFCTMKKELGVIIDDIEIAEDEDVEEEDWDVWYEFIQEHWADSEDYECKALFRSWKLTYFNSEAEEFKVVVDKEEK